MARTRSTTKKEHYVDNKKFFAEMVAWKKLVKEAEDLDDEEDDFEEEENDLEDEENEEEDAQEYHDLLEGMGYTKAEIENRRNSNVNKLRHNEQIMDEETMDSSDGDDSYLY